MKSAQDNDIQHDRETFIAIVFSILYSYFLKNLYCFILYSVFMASNVLTQIDSLSISDSLSLNDEIDKVMYEIELMRANRLLSFIEKNPEFDIFTALRYTKTK